MSNETRKGKHKEGKTLFGAYVEPEIKALAELTSSQLGCTFTEIILNGLRYEATRAGVMKNGEIVEEFRPLYNTLLKMTRDKIANSKKGNK